MKTKMFTLFFALAASVGTMFAEKVQIGDLYYNLNATNQTAEVTYDGNYRGLTTANIPASVTYSGTSYSVTSIGGSAFSYCRSLTSVTIPNSVTSIGNEAFFGCSSLTSVTIPNSVTSIGNEAFFGCSSLTSVTIPNSVTSIGQGAFYNCSSLTSVTIGNSVTSIGSYVFSGCSSLTSVTIPNSVTSIGNEAFFGCSGLTSPVYNAHVFAYMPKSYSGAYTIPDGIASIAGYAFDGCSSLTSVTIPNSVTSISSTAFNGCRSLTAISVAVGNTTYDSRDGCNAVIKTDDNELVVGCKNTVIPNSVTMIGENAFRDKGLTSITIPKNISRFGHYALYGNTDLTSVIWLASQCEPLVPDYKTYTVGDEGTQITEPIFKTASFFYGCSITSIKLGDEVRSIPDYFCHSKTGLTSLIIPSNVKSIGIRAFDCCSGLTSVTIPNSDISIGEWAFGNCSGLNTVTIPDNVTSIGEAAFISCGGLTSVVIGNGVTSIGGNAFSSCSSLTSVTIGNSVTSIGSSAFFDCSSLTSVTIPNSVTSIGNYAFSNCSSLTSVTIPNSVTSIGDYAFSRCSSLTSVYVEGEIPANIGNSAFNNTNNCPIYIPCGTYSDYRSAWSAYANRLQYEAMVFPYSLACSVNMEEAGYVHKPTSVCDSMKVTAVANSGYHFVQWSDGIIDNPRTIQLFQDTAFTAEFALDKSGTCGKDLALAWEYNDENKTLTISGNGELTANYSYSIAAKYAQHVIINEGVTNIGEFANITGSNLITLTLPKSVTNIANYAFYGCSNISTIYEQSATPPSINSYSFSNNNIDVYVPFGGERRYKSTQVWKDMTIHAPSLAKEVNAYATSCVIAFSVENIELQSCGVVDGDTFVGNVLEFIGLEPESEYTKTIVLTSNAGETETINVSFTTTALSLTTQQPKVVSSNTAILLAETNMADAEMNCGFEWKRNDAPADMAGTKVYAPVANGVIAGRLKGLKDDVYYKYRAFYESTAGNKYYGDWQYIFTGDEAVEFDPIMYTYPAQAVTETTATLKGYALAGADDFTEQGFEYWVEVRVTIQNGGNAPRRAYHSAIGEHKTVQASGISMKVTLTDLDEGSVYKYRTYAVVDGQKVYGAEQSFTTRGEYLYTVTFVDYDGTILGTDKVHYGTAATAPEDPTRDGYHFDGWDNDFSNVTDDLTITATYSIATAIADTRSENNAVRKVIRNGQIFILRDGHTYTVQGQEVR